MRELIFFFGTIITLVVYLVFFVPDINKARCDAQWSSYSHKHTRLTGCMVDIKGDGVYVPAKNIYILKGN